MSTCGLIPGSPESWKVHSQTRIAGAQVTMLEALEGPTFAHHLGCREEPDVCVLVGVLLGPKLLQHSIHLQAMHNIAQGSQQDASAQQQMLVTYSSACQLSSLHITGMAAESSCTWLI